MDYITFAAVAGVAIIFIVIVLNILGNRKLKKTLRQNYGKAPTHKYKEDDMESITSYWLLREGAPESRHAVDDTTWKDLDLDSVFKRMNATCSSVGEEYFYAALHAQEYDGEKLTELENAVQFFDTHENERLKAQYALSKLGKVSGNGLIDFVCNSRDRALPFHLIYPLLSLLAVLSIIMCFVNVGIGVPALILILVTNIIVYSKTKYSLDAELISVHYISSMITCAKKLTAIKADDIHTGMEKLKKAYIPMKAVGRLTGAILSKSSNDMDFLKEYIKILFLLDFIMYNRAVAAISKHLTACMDLYESVGFLDTAIAVASYRRSVPFYTVPTFTGTDEIDVVRLAHPMLDNPVANTVTLRRSSLITGSNASGKSTFVKALAVNAILAQTVNTCIAEKFRIKPSFVVTSMAVSDSLEAGDSYYIAEVKSLKRVLDGLNSDVRCLCFIDEILKGTNTIERIAASASILKYLSNGNCFAIVATHDIELTEITASLFDNYHFQEHITDSGISFDYIIYEGWATTKNAIRLLDFMHYDPSITGTANQLAGEFEANRVWGKLKDL